MTMKIDKVERIDAIKAKYAAVYERGLISENESMLMQSLYESRKYTPAFVLWINGTDYANIYGVFDSTGELIGTYAAYIAGRYAGKHETCVYKAGYNKRDINRLYKEYRI